MSVERNRPWTRWLPCLGVAALLLYLVSPLLTQAPRAADGDKAKGPPPSSYDQVTPVLLGQQSYQEMKAKDEADKGAVMARQKKLLEERYDLTPHADKQVTMTRGK